MDAEQVSDTPPVQDEEWNIGDFVLQSSDDVIFKVNSYVLFGAR